MPSPFNNDETPVEHSTGARVEEEKVSGSLFCEYCFQESHSALYSPQAKRIRWDCVACGRENVVRNIEL